MGSLDTPHRRYTFTEIQQAIPDFRQIRLPGSLVASVTYPQGSRVGELTATPGTYALYNAGGADGSQNPKAIIPRDLVTDANGNIFVGTTTTGEFGESETAVPLIFGGAYRTEDLPSLTTAEVTGLGGKLIQGTVTSGILTF